jgi:hypothetical protein
MAPTTAPEPDAASEDSYADLCPNCGIAPIDHQFCSFCGQKRFDPHPLGAFTGTREFFAEAYSVSIELFRTLLELLVPGRLTLAYLAGRTVGLLSPMKLFLVAFGWLTLIVTQVILGAGPAGIPTFEGVRNAAEWAQEAVTFFVPLGLIGLLRLIWGPRRENYPFALHSYAFLAFIVLPAQDYFPHIALFWISVSAWRIYGRIDPATASRDYSIKGLVGRSAATTMAVCVVFTVVLLMLSLLQLAPMMAAALTQPARFR